MTKTNLSPEHAEAVRARQIEERLKALERRTPSVPVLEDDPAPESRCRLWIVGTQLRYRDANGTVRRVSNP